MWTNGRGTPRKTENTEVEECSRRRASFLQASQRSGMTSAGHWSLANRGEGHVSSGHIRKQNPGEPAVTLLSCLGQLSGRRSSAFSRWTTSRPGGIFKIPCDSSRLPQPPQALQLTYTTLPQNPIYFCAGFIRHQNGFNLWSFSLAPRAFPSSNVVSHPIWLWQDSFKDQTSLKLGIGWDLCWFSWFSPDLSTSLEAIR